MVGLDLSPEAHHSFDFSYAASLIKFKQLFWQIENLLIQKNDVKICAISLQLHLCFLSTFTCSLIRNPPSITNQSNKASFLNSTFKFKESKMHFFQGEFTTNLKKFANNCCYQQEQLFIFVIGSAKLPHLTLEVTFFCILNFAFCFCVVLYLFIRLSSFFFVKFDSYRARISSIVII